MKLNQIILNVMNYKQSLYRNSESHHHSIDLNTGKYLNCHGLLIFEKIRSLKKNFQKCKN